jgi:lipid-A-disaccharide synthase
MMPTFMAFADRMHALPEYADWQFVVAGAPSRSLNDYTPYLSARPERAAYVRVVFGQSGAVMRHAEAAVVNSGTASLECALVGTPQVVGYRMSQINFLIGRKLIKVKWISLGNLILNRTCFRELMQYYFTPENVLTEVRRLIEDEAYRERMREGYRTIRKALGGTGASVRVARAMIEEIKNKK